MRAKNVNEAFEKRDKASARENLTLPHLQQITDAKTLIEAKKQDLFLPEWKIKEIVESLHEEENGWTYYLLNKVESLIEAGFQSYFPSDRIFELMKADAKKNKHNGMYYYWNSKNLIRLLTDEHKGQFLDEAIPELYSADNIETIKETDTIISQNQKEKIKNQFFTVKYYTEYIKVFDIFRETIKESEKNRVFQAVEKDLDEGNYVNSFEMGYGIGNETPPGKIDEDEIISLAKLVSIPQSLMIKAISKFKDKGILKILPKEFEHFGHIVYFKGVDETVPIHTLLRNGKIASGIPWEFARPEANLLNAMFTTNIDRVAKILKEERPKVGVRLIYLATTWEARYKQGWKTATDEERDKTIPRKIQKLLLDYTGKPKASTKAFYLDYVILKFLKENGPTSKKEITELYYKEKYGFSAKKFNFKFPKNLKAGTTGVETGMYEINDEGLAFIKKFEEKYF